MMRKQQHFFPAILQRTHKRCNKRCLCHAGRLPFAAPDLFLQQRAFPCVRMQCQQAPQLIHHRTHQFTICLIVRVDFLYKSALRRQLCQHFFLCSAQNQAFSSEMLAQQRRITHQMVSIAVAPRAREALPIAQTMIVQNIDDIPDFRAFIIDWRAGQPNDPFTLLCQKACRRILFCSAMTQFLYFVKNDRLEPHLRQSLLPAAQQQIMNDIDIRFRRLIGLQACQHADTCRFSLQAQKARDFRLPVP